MAGLPNLRTLAREILRGRSLFSKSLDRFLSALSRLLFFRIPTEHYERWGLYGQAVFIVCCYGFFYLRPAFTGKPIWTGYAIAALAFAGIIMTAKGSLSNLEKIVWIFVCGALFVWELNIIDQNQTASEIQHKQDLQQQQERFEATEKHAEEIFKKTNEAANAATHASEEITGGKSFAYFYFSELQPQNISLVKNGYAPLYDINAEIYASINCTKRDSNNNPVGLACSHVYMSQVLPVGDLETGSIPAERLKHISLDKVPANAHLPPSVDHALFFVRFTARNGTWREYEWIARLSDNTSKLTRYVIAVEVYRDLYAVDGRNVGRKLIHSEVPEDFPRTVLDDLKPQ